ncbi:MAG: hypothetical protein ABSE62_00045 [Chthoniobacteraceae bacterium]|jgi:hypothetical protein
MKNSLLALCLALLLTSCAGVRVTHTDVATGATNPRAIYIRPFDISDCTWKGHQRGGQSAILQSLAPAVFAEDLKEELEKLAPALVLKPGDYPTTGWLVEGSFDLVNAGNPMIRSAPCNFAGNGRSYIQIHVRILDMGAHSGIVVDSKDVGVGAGAQTQPVKTRHGIVIYEFDLAGGSRLTGFLGSVTAPGLGYAPPFDYRNAAERVYEALDPDEFEFGLRDSPTIR